jgi:hypothetical protein
LAEVRITVDVSNIGKVVGFVCTPVKDSYIEVPLQKAIEDVGASWTRTAYD